jgi:hypothetical protein
MAVVFAVPNPQAHDLLIANVMNVNLKTAFILINKLVFLRQFSVPMIFSSMSFRTGSITKIV